MIKYFNLDDSEEPGIVRVEIVKQDKKVPISNVRVIAIIKPSSFRKCKLGSKLVVANRLLRDEL